MFEAPVFSTLQICRNMLEREPDFQTPGICNFLNKVIKAGLVSLLKKGSGKRSSFIEVEDLLQIMSLNTLPIAQSSSHGMNF